MMRLLWLCFLLLGGSVFADDDGWQDDNHSYDQARHALHKGEVKSLTEITHYLRQYSNGDIVAIEYEYEFGRWVYEFVMIEKQGYMSKIHIDAQTGSLIQVSDD